MLLKFVSKTFSYNLMAKNYFNVNFLINFISFRNLFKKYHKLENPAMVFYLNHLFDEPLIKNLNFFFLIFLRNGFMMRYK